MIRAFRVKFSGRQTAGWRSCAGIGAFPRCPLPFAGQGRGVLAICNYRLSVFHSLRQSVFTISVFPSIAGVPASLSTPAAGCRRETGGGSAGQPWRSKCNAGWAEAMASLPRPAGSGSPMAIPFSLTLPVSPPGRKGD